MAGRIEDYALLGDMQTAALVGRDGSIDWLCFPRFDSGACFAALLGTKDNGSWRLAPAAAAEGRACTRRGYRGESLVLETIWESAEGTARVIDFMPPRGEAPDVVRIVEGVSGRVAMRSEMRLRFDYGRTVPWVRRIDHQTAGIAGPDSVWLRTSAPVEGRDMATWSDFAVSSGEQVGFVLTWNPSHLPPPRPVNPIHALEQTEAFWSEWMTPCTYTGRWAEAVRRSLVTLKALTYSPTGGIVAAATTSLPEAIGGERNWDYRFCWLRDATFTLQSLLLAGFTEEAKAWREWLLRAIAGAPADLQIMYGVAGERRLVETQADWLPGYEGSRPVRLGNAAVDQLQLDVYGEVLDSLSLARAADLGSDQAAWQLQKALLEHLEGRWHEPDEGLWEVRGGRRNFTHSKVMAWVAADRAIHAVEESGLDGPVERWKAMRREVHRDVLANAWDDERRTFTQSYGSSALDASLLLIPQVGFLPPDDPRVVGTIEAIQRELVTGPFVQRYSPANGDEHDVDGLAGAEGAFLMCSFWLADDLHLIGRTKEAVELYESLLELRNDVGLLSEEYDPRARRMLGNIPQAFSHVPLVITAFNLDQTPDRLVWRLHHDHAHCQS